MRSPTFRTTPPFGGEHQRLFGRFGTGTGIGAHDGHFVAHGLFHQLRRGQEVVVEVLFDDGQVAGGEGDGLGADLGGDVLEFEALARRRSVRRCGDPVLARGHRRRS